MRTRRLIAVLTLAATVTALGAIAPPAAAAPGDVGFRDFTYADPAPGRTATAPTGQKPQSKLWFADGSWWGVLFNAAVGDFQIYRYDWPSHTWSTTGVLVDERSSSFVDVLWDAASNKVYVGAAGMKSTDPSLDATRSPKVMRFTYNPATDTYSLDAGFPVTIGSGGVEAVVIDKDSTGLVWATFTQGSKVRVTHSTPGNDAAWVTPFVLPSEHASISDDDISAVVAYDGNKIGVMWSNRTDETVYFATHADGAPDNQWTVVPAYQKPEGSDDHINLKSLQADPAGRVFAALKTSLNAPGDPLVHLLVLQAGSTTWTSHPFGTVADDHTRPIVLIDAENREVYMFAATPCCAGGTIVYKKSSLDDIEFPAGVGTTFMKSAQDPEINNPTSTKQNLNSQTDLVVMAGDDSTRRYLHNRIELAAVAPPPPGTPPDTSITAGPSGPTASTSGSFSFTSTGAGATFECSLDGAAFSGCSSPKGYSALSQGAHTFAVRSADANGTDPTPATRQWVVDTVAPETTIQSGPSGTTTVTSATFSFTSSEAGSTFACRLDDKAPAACTSPVTYSGLAPGSHQFRVQATDAAGNTDLTAALRGWTVAQGSTPPPPPSPPAATGFTDGFEDGSLAKWTVATGEGGSAVAQSDVVKSGSFAARLDSTGGPGSFASASAGIGGSSTDVTAGQDVQVLRDGPASEKAVGYWTVASDGGVFAFGDAPFFGSTGAMKLAQPIVGMAATPSGNGYWMVAADGGIFAFGDAKFFGSTGAMKLAQPIVGMAATPTGKGYWLVARDGGIFAFGDAAFFGSTGAMKLAQPVVGMAATPTGNGYWFVAADGGIFAFGDATFFGSTGAMKLAQPIVGMAATPSGKGYRLVASDGGIFGFGDGSFHGSTGALKLARPVVGMSETGGGKGYWLVASDGGIFGFGDATFHGSTGALKLAQPIVGMASRARSVPSTPLLTLTGADGAEVVSVLRQRATGRIQVRHGGQTTTTATRLPLGEWARLELHAVSGGAVELKVGGTVVHSADKALGGAAIAGVALGSPGRGLDYAVAVDDVSVQP